MAAVAAHREEFEFDRHCRGPNLDATPNDIIRRIERYSGVKTCRALRNPGSRPRGKAALQVCPPEWHSRLADFHGRRAGPARYEQWRPRWPIGRRTYRIDNIQFLIAQTGQPALTSHEALPRVGRPLPRPHFFLGPRKARTGAGVSYPRSAGTEPARFSPAPASRLRPDG